ncbi:DNA internalization-related competence protein ComEC/Rec2 [Alkalibacterium sp. m-11]
MIRGRLIIFSILIGLLVSYILTGYTVLLLILISAMIKTVRSADRRLTGLIIFSLAVVTIRMHAADDQFDPSDSIPEDSYLVEVKQTSWTVDGDRLRFQGLAMNEKVSHEVMVVHRLSSEQEKEERRALIPSHLLIEGELNQPGQATNFNQFDYRTYLNRKNITYVLYTNEIEDIDLAPSFLERAYKTDSLRQDLLNYCDRIFQPTTGRYIKALIFADRRELGAEVTETFKKLGIIHLLSISGLHVSLLIGMMDRIMTGMTVTRESKRLVFLFILPVFYILAGFGISIYRAAMQAWIRYLSDTLDWHLTSLDCWGLTFCLAVFVRPVIIFSVGFQLSFLMSFILLFLSDQAFFRELSGIKQIVLVNCALFAFSVPVLSFHFYELSWGVLFLNSLFVPYVTYLLMPALLILFVTSPLLALTQFGLILDELVRWVIVIMEKASLIIDQAMSLMVVTGRFSGTMIVLWIVFCILGLLQVEKSKKLISTIPVAALLLLLINVNTYSPIGQVMMIDVGQGDAVLIKEPFGRGSVLIDTGGLQVWNEKEEWQIRSNDYTLGEEVLIPVMKSLGIRTLDQLVITHPHWDHYGAMSELIHSFPVKTLVMNDFTKNHSAFRQSLSQIKEGALNVRIIKPDEPVKLTDQLHVIHDNWTDQTNENNQSIVLLGRYGRLDWLFTGDIEEVREKNIMKHFPELNADVLKVAHHGSRTSTHEAFLKQIDPDYALISVGENNRFGHPYREKIDQLSGYPVSLFRTDENGGIRYTYSDLKYLDNYLQKKGAFNVMTDNDSKESNDENSF